MSRTLSFPIPPHPRRGNQGHFVPPTEEFAWHGLVFRTRSELAIAKAFDAAGVTFFPGCVCRITDSKGARVKREPDFLVIHFGVAAILELDGKPHQGRAAYDHTRDRLFKRRAGIWVIERVPSQFALEHPNVVVRGFLDLILAYRETA